MRSDAAAGDSGDASGFISLIDFKSEHVPEDLAASWPGIEPVLRLLVERQERSEDYADEWAFYGCFRSRIHEIVKRGFAVSFDTSAPEVVPESVSLKDFRFSCRNVSWPVAVQLLRHSGADGLDGASSRRDVLRVLGPPDAARAGDHPSVVRFHVPDWILYHRPECSIRLQFEGDAIANVMLGSHENFIAPVVPGGPTVDDFKRAALAVWEAYLATLPPDRA